MSWQGFVPGPQGDRKSKGKKGGVASKVAAFQQQSRNFGDSSNAQSSSSNNFNAQKKKSWNTHNQVNNFQAPAAAPAPSWSQPGRSNMSQNQNFNASAPPKPMNSWNNNNNSQNSWNNQPKPAPVTAPSWNNSQNHQNSWNNNQNQQSSWNNAQNQPQNSWNNQQNNQNSWNNQQNNQNSWSNQQNNQNSWNNQQNSHTYQKNDGWNNNKQPVIKPPYANDYSNPKSSFNPLSFLEGASKKSIGIGIGVFMVMVLVIVVAAAASGGNEEGELRVVRFPAETRRGNNAVGLLVLSDLNEEESFAFINAADTWSNIIAGTPLVGRTFAANQNVCVQGRTFGTTTTIDHIAIFAAVAPIDGPSNTLAQAGPCVRDVNQNFPTIGNMLFDEADIGGLVARNTLVSVILHEMGHVLERRW